MLFLRKTAVSKESHSLDWRPAAIAEVKPDELCQPSGRQMHGSCSKSLSAPRFVTDCIVICKGAESNQKHIFEWRTDLCSITRNFWGGTAVQVPSHLCEAQSCPLPFQCSRLSWCWAAFLSILNPFTVSEIQLWSTEIFQKMATSQERINWKNQRLLQELLPIPAFHRGISTVFSSVCLATHYLSSTKEPPVASKK